MMKNLFLKIKIRAKKTIKRGIAFIGVDGVNNQSDIVFLTSMGRSGSTLVSKLVTSTGKFRSFHEPFHPKKGLHMKNFHVHGLYLDPKENRKDEFQRVEKILEGKIYNDWTSSGDYSFYFNKRIIKTIRTNLMVPWIKHNFPDIKLIILIRNPFAVIDSWVKMSFGNGDVFREKFFQQRELIEKIPPIAVEFYKSAMIDKEKLIFQWCIQYYILFTHLEEHEFKLIVYERLLLDSKKEMNELFDFLNLLPNDKWKQILNKPSMTTRKDSDINNRPGSISEKWRNSWTREEIEKGYEIMRLFNMGDLYNENYPSKTMLLNLKN